MCEGQTLKIIGVIPARLGSTRLPAKILRDLAGRPMIQHVYECAKKAAKLDDLIVACDDASVLECVGRFGGKALLTRIDHPNGTSRVFEIAGRCEGDVLINIQGDEPMIHPNNIDLLAGIFLKDKNVQAATLAVRKCDVEGYLNPNVVKVVCDQNGDALYFSRSPIPKDRDSGDGPSGYLKHLGIYGYRKKFLSEFVRWTAGELERREKLEQLRIVERGFKIRVAETPHDSLSVDTEEDLRAVESAMSR
jgi:3-deoxy-manno-octulosonate cytidylyltransferase (CMP-KDO synthetase)